MSRALLQQSLDLLDDDRNPDHLRLAEAITAALAQPEPAPHFRGYASLGTGQYLLNHSAAGEEPEFVISVATDAEKVGRIVGDLQAKEPESLLQPDAMAVRIAFASVAGLDAMEVQLRELRKVHFPETAPPAPDTLTQSTHAADVSKKDAEIDRLHEYFADMTAQRDRLMWGHAQVCEKADADRLDAQRYRDTRTIYCESNGVPESDSDDQTDLYISVHKDLLAKASGGQP